MKMNKSANHLKHDYHYILMLSEKDENCRNKQRIVKEWLFDREKCMAMKKMYLIVRNIL